MAIYTGETLVITHTAASEGTALTDTDVVSVEIEIFDSDDVVVIDDTAMTWDSVQARWEYVWRTTTADATPVALDAGTYRARVQINGSGSTVNHEYKRIRLKANPVELD